MKYVILALLCTLALSFCTKNVECPSTEYCTVAGKCSPRPWKYCQNTNQCKVCETCQMVNPRLGSCVAMKNLDCKAKTKLTVPEIPVPMMKHTAYEPSIPNGFCGSDKFERERGQEKGIPACGSSVCDDPQVRETFSTPVNKTLKMVFLVFNCSASWSTNAMSKISGSTQEINDKYAGTGFQFRSYIQYFPCRGSDGQQDYSIIDEDKAVQAVIKERGSNFQEGGAFILVTGTPSNSGLLGFMYFPGGQYSGIGFLNSQALGLGQKTLPHELGHAFGLFHTFSGISEVQGCSQCYETTDSDLKGDFCADTPTTIRNWDCYSPLSATGQNADRCTRRSQWINPYSNMMSYGSCPSTFSPCQTKRIRCGFTKSLPWLIPFTNKKESV